MNGLRTAFKRLARNPGFTLLYGVSPEDPKSLAAATLWVVLPAAVATVFPVVRAMRIQPAETLRCEN